MTDVNNFTKASDSFNAAMKGSFKGYANYVDSVRSHLGNLIQDIANAQNEIAKAPDNLKLLSRFHNLREDFKTALNFAQDGIAQAHQVVSSNSLNAVKPNILSELEGKHGKDFIHGLFDPKSINTTLQNVGDSNQFLSWASRIKSRFVNNISEGSHGKLMMRQTVCYMGGAMALGSFAALIANQFSKPKSEAEREQLSYYNRHYAVATAAGIATLLAGGLVGTNR